MTKEIPSKCVGCSFKNIGKMYCNMYRMDINKAVISCTVNGDKPIKIQYSGCRREWKK